MNKFNLTTVAAAIVLAFSANAMAASDVAKDEAQAAAPAAKKESPRAYVDDAVITGKLKALMLEESSLKSTEINVETYKGIVQLTGFVSSRADIDKAVKIARSVKGVKSVKNDMIVKGKQ
ncbi:MAG: BON domain-containing protein [Rhodocyclales bacterium]|nr:BON domain-containing protein [Rhodocyclales bacterium]